MQYLQVTKEFRQDGLKMRVSGGPGFHSVDGDLSGWIRYLERTRCEVYVRYRKRMARVGDSKRNGKVLVIHAALYRPVRVQDERWLKEKDPEGGYKPVGLKEVTPIFSGSGYVYPYAGQAKGGKKG